MVQPCAWRTSLGPGTIARSWNHRPGRSPSRTLCAVGARERRWSSFESAVVGMVGGRRRSPASGSGVIASGCMSMVTLPGSPSLRADLRRVPGADASSMVVKPLDRPANASSPAGSADQRADRTVAQHEALRGAGDITWGESAWVLDQLCVNHAGMAGRHRATPLPPGQPWACLVLPTSGQCPEIEE